LIILLYIIDKTSTTMQNRFEQFKIYEDISGFLFNIKKLKSLGCVLFERKMLKPLKVFETYLKGDYRIGKW